ncbi:HAD family phosphatase [Paenibacillus albiflavus]|uniref:HAD family phosphatase n=1 Tax=Paenibacillus albiflavus TaxID=2545760 RepID=A0A4V2WNK3_9BACL|nr:Cof-type HAD-IIB family hydrolase [Paenibacillus albiflavus]TCZ75852.1 HAD family phosphatase [Paenibacillus albiflavus]
MSTKYKLLALDMDGTVLNEEQKISEENRQAIAAAIEAGITVMFSTGRGVQTVLPYVEQLNLQSPLVSVNGSEVWRAPHELHKRVEMPREIIARLHKMAVETGSWYWAYSVAGLFNRDHWAESIEDNVWLKFGFWEENAELLSKIRAEVASWDLFEITNSNVNNIELNPKGISKGSGMLEVCKLQGIGMHEVIAMGDSLNDLSMIKAAGLGVAMGNAQEELKANADLVTVTNDEHGVAKIIREYMLNP